MFDRLVMWLGGEAKTVAFAIVGGVVGFLAKVAYDLWSARRKERLDRVNKQLKLLYGPLYALNRSSNIAWSAPKTAATGCAVRVRQRPSAERIRIGGLEALAADCVQAHSRGDARDDHQEFRPFDRRRVSGGLENLLRHAAAYKVVFEQWSKNDFSEHFAVVAYPADDLNEYLESSFRRLKSEQGRLLGMRLQ